MQPLLQKCHSVLAKLFAALLLFAFGPRPPVVCVCVDVCVQEKRSRECTADSTSVLTTWWRCVQKETTWCWEERRGATRQVHLLHHIPEVLGMLGPMHQPASTSNTGSFFASNTGSFGLRLLV